MCHRLKYADRVQWFSYFLTKCWRQLVISVTLCMVQPLVYLFQTSETAPGTLVCTYQLWWDRHREKTLHCWDSLRYDKAHSRYSPIKSSCKLQIMSAVMYRRIPLATQLVKPWRGLTKEEKTVAASLFAEKTRHKNHRPNIAACFVSTVQNDCN